MHAFAETYSLGRCNASSLLVVLAGITFAGSSSMFSLTPGSGRPKLLHVMKRRQDGLGLWSYARDRSGLAA